ncbi:MAG: phosphotransferase family protein [Micromonosporaceae bacterium]
MSESYQTDELRRSTRDYAELRSRLEAWLQDRVPGAQVGPLEVPSGNGMSSETVVFDMTTGGQTRGCVARLAPRADAVPVFPGYDLGRQFRVMSIVAEHSGVPVPRPLWHEPDPDPIGTPFLVMERVDGDVPPDVMPYTFGGWLTEADREQRARLQAATVAVLAGIHGVEPPAFLEYDRPGATPLRRHVAEQRAYYEWVADGTPHPLIERCFAWLERHWPAEEGSPVISWGDSRIGNILYRDFRPAGVLDWEMAALGPRELDLGWLIYHHRFFQDLTALARLPGLPDFLRRDEVAAEYGRLTGRPPRDLDFFIVYAALRNAIVMTRVARRQAAFGEREWPENPDEVLYDRASIEALLTGTYWEDKT